MIELVRVADVLMFLDGKSKPSRLVAARANMLSEWRAGRPKYVSRITAPDGRDLTPTDIDWTGIDEPSLPVGRGGRRAGAGRPKGSHDGPKIQRTVLVTLDQAERYDAAAEAEGVAWSEWARDAMDAAARQK